MQGRLFGWTRGVGLALGAALLMAGCAGPTVQTGQPSKAGLTSIDGATVSLAAFENSAFPYHGMIPNYQETGKTRPFLDVDENGRLGHSSPRGESTGRTRPTATAACCSRRRSRSIRTNPL